MPRPLIEIIDLSGVPDTLTGIIDQNMKEPEINLNGWQTITSAAAKWGVTTHVITNWIRRKGFPYREYPELNGLRLVPKDKP